VAVITPWGTGPTSITSRRASARSGIHAGVIVFVQVESGRRAGPGLPAAQGQVRGAAARRAPEVAHRRKRVGCAGSRTTRGQALTPLRAVGSEQLRARGSPAPAARTSSTGQAGTERFQDHLSRLNASAARRPALPITRSTFRPWLCRELVPAPVLHSQAALRSLPWVPPPPAPAHPPSARLLLQAGRPAFWASLTGWAHGESRVDFRPLEHWKMAIPPPVVAAVRQAWQWQWHQLMEWAGRQPMPKATTRRPAGCLSWPFAAAGPGRPGLVSTC